MTTFANALMASSSIYPAVDTARGQTQAFYMAEHIDLADFATRVRNVNGATPELQSAVDGLLAGLGTVIIHADAQNSYPGANGLAIYLPGRNAGADAAYFGEGAVWGLGSTWDDFVQSFAH
jgi:hypothetical protein